MCYKQKCKVVSLNLADPVGEIWHDECALCLTTRLALIVATRPSDCPSRASDFFEFEKLVQCEICVSKTAKIETFAKFLPRTDK